MPPPFRSLKTRSPRWSLDLLRTRLPLFILNCLTGESGSLYPNRLKTSFVWQEQSSWTWIRQRLVPYRVLRWFLATLTTSRPEAAVLTDCIDKIPSPEGSPPASSSGFAVVAVRPLAPTSAPPTTMTASATRRPSTEEELRVTWMVRWPGSIL